MLSQQSPQIGHLKLEQRLWESESVEVQRECRTVPNLLQELGLVVEHAAKQVAEQ